MSSCQRSSRSLPVVVDSLLSVFVLGCISLTLDHTWLVGYQAGIVNRGDYEGERTGGGGERGMTFYHNCAFPDTLK